MQSREHTIVFVNQNAGYLMIDIIRAHQKKYKNCVLITGKLIPRNTVLDTSVKVERIIPYNRSSAWRRLYTWTVGFIQILFLIKTRYRHAELYLVSNPPFATLLPLFCKNKFHLLVFDVYPDALVEYGIWKKTTPLIRIWQHSNKRIFARAASIFSLSEGMKSLLSKYVPSERIKVVSVWTDNSFLKPVPKKENSFISNHRLEDRFLVIYSGNLGYTHELEVLLDCAARVRNSKIMFLIIGDGDKRKLLAEKIESEQLENCLLLPWQDASILPYSLAAADLAVVSLGKQASLLSVPSKTYNLMSVGAPLLCIASKDSELALLVSKYKFGRCYDSLEIDAMVDYIEELAVNQEYYRSLHLKSIAASRDFGTENALRLVV